MNSDSHTMEELIDRVVKFNRARGWNPTPADIAKSITIEAAELLEHFQWDESNRKLQIEKTKQKDWDEIGSEVADVLCYLITFCDQSGIDIAEVLAKKLAKNEEKYPESKFNGKHNEAFYRQQKKKYREGRKR
jgi:dCTP diphosphatase